MKRVLFVLFVAGIQLSGFSQVGINTTAPDAQLDIKSSNQAAPSNKDGILIPKIDAFPLANPTAAQNSMLVYLTTTSAGKQPGFYYWDNATTSWIPIAGTLLAPGTAIGNTMYWNGSSWVNNSNFLYNDGTKVGINTVTPSSTMTVKQDGIGFTQESSSGAAKVGFYTLANNAWLQTHSNIDLYFATNNGGTQMTLQKGTGNLGIGNMNPATRLDVQATTGASVISGQYVNPVEASTSSVYNAAITSNVSTNTGKILGFRSNLTSYNQIETQAVQNNISGSGSGLQYGVNNQFTTTSNATTRYGLFNSFNATAATNYGVYNDLLGTGIKYGSYNEFTNGNGAAYGVYNKFRGSGNATRYGNYTEFWDNGSGDWFGNYVYFEYMSSSGAIGNKYGYFVAIPVAVGGSEIYGVYSEVGNLTNGYSGYFSGRVSIGDMYHPSRHYILPLARGTNGQIMQTDGSGNVTWQNPKTALGSDFWTTTGNAGTSPATHFIGTTDSNDVIFKRYNVRAGILNVYNTSFGVNALNPAVTGINNSAFGANALQAAGAGQYNTGLGTSTLYSNTSGNYNTASGFNSLWYNTSGQQNSGFGVQSLFKNVNGNYNTATGTNSMYENLNGSNNTASGHSAMFNCTGSNNTAIGYNALYNNSTGSNIVAVGYQALFNNNGAAQNTAIGYQALYTNGYYGNSNTAVGYQALYSNTSGTSNTSIGNKAAFSNTTGHGLIAIGASALESNTSGYRNTAVGQNSLWSNTTGIDNTAVGHYSMQRNTTGLDNLAVGGSSLQLNVTGSYNTAIGPVAMQNNIDGGWNVAVGMRALHENSSGYYNTGVGPDALRHSTGTGNTGVGMNAMREYTSGDYNTSLGTNAMLNSTSGSNNTAIGFDAQVPSSTGSNQVRIGNQNVTHAGVRVAWTISSDKRWKSEIRTSNLGIDFIKKLNPVFYTRNNDESKKTEYGFIAQELEAALNASGAANNGIISKDDNGFYGVRYNDLFSPIVKAVQEQQQMIEVQSKTIEIQNEKIKQLETANQEILKRLEKLENK